MREVNCGIHVIIGILKVINQVVDSDPVIAIRINMHQIPAIVIVVVASIQATTVTMAIVIKTRPIADAVNTLTVAIVIMITLFLVQIVMIQNAHQIVMAVAVVTVVFMMAMIENAINIAAESIIKIQVDVMITITEVQNIHPIIMTVVVKMVKNKIIQDTSNVPTDEQNKHQV